MSKAWSVDPSQPGKVDEDIFVSRRKNRNKPRGPPQAVTVLNTATFNERNVALSRHGSMLFFSSDREAVGNLDLYVSKKVRGHHHAPDRRSTPTNLGALVNSTANDIGPGYFQDKHGADVLYFTSNRLGGPGLLDIYASVRGPDGPRGIPTFSLPALVSALSSPATMLVRRSAPTASRSSFSPTACRPPASETSGRRPAKPARSPGASQ